MALPVHLTEEQLAEARRLRAQSMSVRDIAARLGVGKTKIAEVLAQEPKPDAGELALAEFSRREAEAIAQPARAAEPPSPPAPEPASSNALPGEKLDQLRDLLERLPLRQQDRLVAGLRIDQVRMDAVGRALARHPEAARDVARALRALEI
jgi:hypothetical protein